MMQRQIETLAHGCAICGKRFKDRDRISSVYKAEEVRSFERQVELGIIGQHVRNYWLHLFCSDTTLKEARMEPDIQHCVECGNKLNKEDMIIPIFQVIDPHAINPADPTDVGISLAERVYFMHGSCRNKRLNKDPSNILHIV